MRQARKLETVFRLAFLFASVIAPSAGPGDSVRVSLGVFLPLSTSSATTAACLFASATAQRPGTPAMYHLAAPFDLPAPPPFGWTKAEVDETAGALPRDAVDACYRAVESATFAKLQASCQP